ncbi:MAG: hypothetical protein H0V86_07565 [Chloroflexia bacterium]|nr:hypothetical protein [Chloroflexia bacterium]
MDNSSPEAPMVVDHDDPDSIAEVAAAYALDALSAHETRQVRDYLPGCIKCREAVAQMSEPAGMLSYTVEPVEPPDELRRKVLERSRRESAGPPGTPIVQEPE